MRPLLNSLMYSEPSRATRTLDGPASCRSVAEGGFVARRPFGAQVCPTGNVSACDGAPLGVRRDPPIPLTAPGTGLTAEARTPAAAR